MVEVTQLRLGFQILAFSFFVYQMNQSIQKYIVSPVSITKVNHMELILEPVLFVCQPSQFNYNLSSSIGYAWMSSFWAGILTLDGDKKLSWKGKDGNKSFVTLIGELYDYDYSVVKMTHGKLGRDHFSLNLGMCKELVDVQFNKWPTFETNKKALLVAVDPFTQNDLRINYDNNAVASTGNHLDNGLYDGADVMVEYSITDQTILDGVECRNYARINSTYGHCVMGYLQEMFNSIYGCTAPWFKTRKNLTCETDIPIQQLNSTALNDLISLYSSLQTLDVYATQPKDCPKPCTTMNIQIKTISAGFSLASQSGIAIYKSDQIDQYKAMYVYDFFSLLVDLGSALGLWLGLSVLGMFDGFVDIFRSLSGFVNKYGFKIKG